jgi:anti-sigma factor RsiW
MIDPITETDLLGYVDDQIDVARRIDVEDYLAKHPKAAARVMADLRARDVLRLSLAAPLPRPPERMLVAAGRLERRLVWRRIGLKLQRAAAIAVFIGVGWLAHAQIGLGVTDSEASPQPPAFVEDARHAHETALIRSRMVSVPEMPNYDPAEILAETGIRLPELPKDWRVVDAQVFPAREGHSIEMAIEAVNLGRVSLFAAQVSSFNVIEPTVTRFTGTKVVYWQTGPLAYALTGTASETLIERAALRLSRKVQ